MIRYICIPVRDVFKLNVHQAQGDSEKDEGVDHQTESGRHATLKDAEGGLRPRHGGHESIHYAECNGIGDDVEQETLEGRDLELLDIGGCRHAYYSLAWKVLRVACIVSSSCGIF